MTVSRFQILRTPSVAKRPAFLLMAVLAVQLAGCFEQVAEPGPVEEPVAPVRAVVRVDKAVATTGDIIEYSIEIDHAPGLEITLPESGAEIAGFRIIDAGQDGPREDSGRILLRAWYRLRADLVGSYILPAVSIPYADAGGSMSEIETSEIFVEVESVLPGEGQATDIRDVKELREIDRDLPWPWILGAGAAVLGAALLLWWRRRRKAASVVPSRPPHEMAFESLARLRATDFGDLESLRRYYFEISEVLRTYVEDRFGLNATDLTTEEIVPRLSGLLAPELEDRLRRFLFATDGVKFAAQIPDESEIEATYEAALGFVEATVPNDSEPPEVPGPDSAAAPVDSLPASDPTEEVA